MKVQIIYSSLSGCTKKVAETIFNKIDETDKEIYNIKDGIPELTGDIIIFGYWGNMGLPDENMQNLLKSVKNKAVGVFCTLGYYSGSKHAFDTLQSGVDFLKENNTIIGAYVCNGAISKELIEGSRKRGGATPQKELRWEITKNHPTESECTLAAEVFNERIELYKKYIENNLEFTSIL